MVLSSGKSPMGKTPRSEFTTDGEDSPTLRRLVRDVGHDLWRSLMLLIVFEAAFKGAVIALARGRIKLQIELKYYGRDRGLARKVTELIRREDFESHEVVTFRVDSGTEMTTMPAE